jgi:plasmid stabilization system protein ParE
VIYSLVITAEAEDDITAAADWYDQQRPGLARRFREDVYRLTKGLLDYPRLYQRHRADVRQAPLKRFPYAVHYSERGEQIYILACFYCGRDPDLRNTRL